jgi:two-component system sensor histidine kinase KdpD
MPRQRADDGPPPGRLATELLDLVAAEVRARVAPATAAVDGLRDAAVDWSDVERRELLGVAQGSLQEVGLLLREVAALSARAGPAGEAAPAGSVPALVHAALADLGEGVQPPRTHLPGSLPPVAGDPALLRLVLVSLLRRAVRTAGPAGADVRAARRGDRVLVRIGSSPPAGRSWADGGTRPLPGDRDRSLGPDLTVARALAQVLGGTLRTDGEGAGAATVLTLAVAPAIAVSPPGGPRG